MFPIYSEHTTAKDMMTMWEITQSKRLRHFYGSGAESAVIDSRRTSTPSHRHSAPLSHPGGGSLWWRDLIKPSPVDSGSRFFPGAPAARLTIIVTTLCTLCIVIDSFNWHFVSRFVVAADVVFVYIYICRLQLGPGMTFSDVTWHAERYSSRELGAGRRVTRRRSACNKVLWLIFIPN
jgi:hypothetical protein